MIHTGNCIEWLATLEAKSVDHCITDPPYDPKTHGAQRRQKIGGDRKRKFRGVRRTELGFDAITEDEIDAVSFHLARVVRRWILIFASVELAPNVATLPRALRARARARRCMGEALRHAAI